MKILSKLAFILVLIAASLPTLAQITVKGGLNLSNMVMKDNDGTYSDNFKMKPGFHLGITSEFKINDMASFETGLLLMSKGFKDSEKETYGGETYTYDENVSLLYLDVPLLAKAYFNVGDMRIYGALGPYVGMGLSGKDHWESSGTGGSDSGTDDIKWGSGDQDHLKRLDYGVWVGAGVEMKSIMLGAFYNFGLANISASTTGGSKINNRVLGISVGYIINKKN